MKKEKDELFKRRVMGDKGMSKAEREQIRRRNQQLRDDWDMNNIGDYKLAYPARNDPVMFI